jgi:lipopolysaccharide/colanic/teichoic acid biosynthesis glycosyltransferase
LRRGACAALAEIPEPLMLRPIHGPTVVPPHARPDRTWPVVYALAKRLFDIGFSLVILLPLLVLVAGALLVLNPFLNPGPLFYRPQRMGRGCVPFRLYKFRTMDAADAHAAREPDDPVETERVTRLGAFLRRARFDELPQALNVLRGEMSLIGPRPDDLPHAHAFLADIPGYGQRYEVRPGISGLAQVELGYVHGRAGACQKTKIDLHYIRHAGLRLDWRVFWRTLRIVADLKGQ